ncbi:MAG: type I DNA topoisomerase, partial [Planctomycetota bacterium]|nr:type I DNA topoisomerase [Planctomycetota bacterium]
MATKKKKKAAAKTKNSKALVIVESPAKARTISRFLGSDYIIEASVGHVRDLPANAAEVPAKYKKEKWSRLGINIEEDFSPLYVVPKDKREHMRHLKALVKEASVLYLATDEDREGESISWHLLQELKPKVDIRRLVFHEITKKAIEEALASPREIDTNLVEAQETRRLVDRLYGYEVSPLLWKKIKPRLSAGRVQSVAVKLVVEREKDRIKFKPANYWGIKGSFLAKGTETPFDANLITLDGKRLAIGKDFDPDTGELKDPDKKLVHLEQAAAQTLQERLETQDAKVLRLEKKPYTQKPAPPFTTSTLQQEAGRKLRFTAKRAMQAAQRLYENGFITYMRTDSTTLSGEAITASRSLIKDSYGDENLPDEPRIYATKVKNAQEAHEAIRPAGATFKHPNELAAATGPDEKRIYELIWQRTVASQMMDARGHRTVLGLGIDEAEFQATGKTVEFPGFRLAYVETAEDSEAALADAERLLPNVEEGDEVKTKDLEASEHTTQPPARLTEASLIKEMEARGIGRPSTYASIIDTILARDYVYKKSTALVPTFTAFAVTNLLESHLAFLVDYEFTAKMESDLDEISNGKRDRLSYLKEFFHGNGNPGLDATLRKVQDEIDPRVVCGIPLGKNEDGTLVEIRVGRWGPFLSCGDLRVSILDGTAPDELTLEMALDLLEKGAQGPKSLGVDPDFGVPVFVKTGRFGPYFQRGDAESLPEGEKPKMASLLKDMDPETVTLDQGIATLNLPRELGVQMTKKTEE